MMETETLLCGSINTERSGNDVELGGDEFVVAGIRTDEKTYSYPMSNKYKSIENRDDHYHIIDCKISDSDSNNNDNNNRQQCDGNDDDDFEIHDQHDYHVKNRFTILLLVGITPLGVKFFKAAQSSFQEYLMTDPRIMMSATTYSLMLSLMSLPAATLIGGILLDYNHRRTKRERKYEHDDDDSNNGEHDDETSCIEKIFDLERLSCLGTTRGPSNSAIAFLGISMLGIILYGYGLEVMNNQSIALIGAAIFGLGEGCVVVASRTFVAHAFYGSDGAFAQGVLVAINNLAMIFSKVSIPWLIENQKTFSIIGEGSIGTGTITTYDDDTDTSIGIGIVACCATMLLSLGAGILYAYWFGASPCPKRKIQQKEKHSCYYSDEPQQAGEPSGETSERRKVDGDQTKSKSIFTSMTTYCRKLPQTFWIVAIARAIFVVTFKVFSHNSNSFLMEKFGVDAVAAGRKSSLHEMFALLSPLVGYLAYRSPGGILIWLLGAAILGTISIASITYLPAQTIQDMLPGGAVTPMTGISIAHGVFIPICIAVIPLTVPEEQLGMAFAVVEVLGSVLSLTNIVFGWLRDATGYYHAPMELLFVYSLIGTCLVWVSRNHLNLQQPKD